MQSTSRKIYTTVNAPDSRQISIIIPAAGFGNRMKSYGPKSLVKIKDNLTILDNQLRYVFKYFYKPEVIVVAGYEFGKVEAKMAHRPNVKVVRNPNWERNNVTASISYGLRHATHKYVLVLYGDLVFNAWALKAPFGSDSMLLIDNSGLMKDEEVGTTTNQNMLVQMMYCLPNKWAQIAYFTGDELRMLYEIAHTPKNWNMFGFEIINQIVARGGQFTCYSPKRMKITDIDSSKDLQKVSDII